ncbi:MAG: hypothetical protein ACLQDQ_15110 [Myxococcaceae bacterium]
MRRVFLLPLLASALAFGLPTLSRSFSAHSAPRSAVEDSGLLSTSQGSVPFTLYWPDGARSVRTLVIFAADAQTPRPRPLRLLAEATAATGVAAVYLAPSAAPEEAAARLKGLLQRHANGFGLEGARVWTWVEGRHLESPAAPRCQQSSPLAAAVRFLRGDSALVRTALELALGTGCAVTRRL